MKLFVGLIFAGLIGTVIWRLKKTPKYKVPFEVRVCDEYCRCEKAFFSDVRYFNGQWEYWMPYPENTWVPESLIDEAIAHSKGCMS